MTERLYYRDAYCLEFSGTIEAVDPGDVLSVVRLDAGYFYPTSGGQPHDLGTLNDWPIRDVRVAADGAVEHLVAAQVDPALVGTTVRGVIDRARRFDFMQQHSGQHLLSQTFYQLLGYETISVHFGDQLSTLDLDVAEISDTDLSRVEHFANQQIYAALAIKAYFVDDVGLQAIPIRKAPKVSDTIRIVEIDGFDYSACGGTHVRSTAELGLIKLLRRENRSKGVRITFVCGGRALADYERRTRLLAAAAALFSTDPAEVPALIERMQIHAKARERRVDELTERLATYEVQELLSAAQSEGDVRIVVAGFDDRDSNAVRKMANLLQGEAATVALLAYMRGEKLSILFARSDDVQLHMGNLLRATLQQFGGAAGGRPELAQGGGIAAKHSEAILKAALTSVQQTLRGCCKDRN